jgi:hypothetical protein
MTAMVIRVEPCRMPVQLSALPGGMMLADLLRFTGKVPETVWEFGRISIGGVPVPREWWPRVRVKPNATVFVRVVPKGGGGDTKDIISSVALIAVVAGAALISGGALVPFLGAGFAAGSFGATAAAFGFTVLGSLAVGALAPPPVTPTTQAASLEQKSIAGVTGNPLNRREFVPRVLGRMRVSPPHLMFPFSVLEEQDVTARLMVGLAGRHKLEGLEINNAPADDFTALEYELKEGAPDDGPIALFEGKSGMEQSAQDTLQGFQCQDGDEVVNGFALNRWLANQANPERSVPKWYTYKSAGVPDQLLLRLFWPAGMISQTENRGLTPFIMQFRRFGDPDWINGPELMFSERDAQGRQTRANVEMRWEEPPVGGTRAHQTNNTAVYAFGTSSQAYTWTADAYFQKGSSYYAENVQSTRDGFVIYLDPAVFPKDVYEVRIKRGFQVNFNSFDPDTYDWDSRDMHFYDTQSTEAPYVCDNNLDDQSGIVILESVCTRSDDYPIAQTGLSLIAVEAVGVTVESVSVIATSYAETRDAFVWHFHEQWEVDQWSASLNVDLSMSVHSVMTATPNANDPVLRSPSGLALNGSIWNTIRIKLRRDAGSGWDGFVFWSTGSGTNYSKSVSVAEPAGIDDDFVTLEFDMSTATGTGADWIGSTIDYFEVHLGASASSADVFSVDFIAVGVADGEPWQVAPTTNPAALYRHVLKDDLNAKALPAETIDETELRDWYERCLDLDRDCNLIANGFTVDQLLQVIAAAGWAVPRQSQKWGVIQERDLSGEAPSQFYTQLNARGFKQSKAFKDLPHALVGEYFDRTDNFKLAEVVRYLPGYNAANATLFESIRYDGITRFEQLYERLGLDVGQLLYRQNTFQIETDIRHLVTGRGGLVGLAYDVLHQMYSSAFITEVLDDGGGNITGFVLDQTVTISAEPIDVFSVTDPFALPDAFGDSAASGVTVQETDGSTLTLPIDETSDSNTLTLSTPLADPGTITAGMLVAIGRIGRETRRCRVMAIDRVEDLQARLTLVDEAPEIHQGVL